MNNINVEIHKLNRRILGRVENEFAICRDNFPELTRDLENMYKRLRKGILDEIADVERKCQIND